MPFSKYSASSDRSLLWMSGLGARVAAASGRAGDRYHLGKLVLQSLRDDPTFISQIDGVSGARESAGSLLSRSVRCALALRALGVGAGDVAAVMAPNHLDIVVPLYACLTLGVAVAAIHCNATREDLQNDFDVTRPRVIFCQDAHAQDVQLALNALGLDSKVVTFDGGVYQCSLQQFMQDFAGDVTDDDVEKFSPCNFDAEETLATLLPTSGTTGVPKFVAATHKHYVLMLPYTFHKFQEFPTPTRMALLASPLLWVTCVMTLLYGAIYRVTRLQSPHPIDKDHGFELINKYRPTIFIGSPTVWALMMQAADRDTCDFSSFECIYMGGSAVHKELLEQIKEVMPAALSHNVYGLTECTGKIFIDDDVDNTTTNHDVGRTSRLLQCKLVHPTTHQDIEEPNTNGELWLRGESLFKGYYRRPEATAETMTSEGWFRTGDLFRRDETGRYYYVDRLKMMLKYKGYQVSPIEIEKVIARHPAVAQVVVVGIPEPVVGDLVVAVVQKKKDCDVTAHEIKDLVQTGMSDINALRGGVLFLPQLPTTGSGKIARAVMQEMVRNMERE